MSREILTRPAPRADMRIAYGATPLHFGDLRLPGGAGPHPVVTVIHGGFWRAQFDLTYIGHLCAALTAAGMATWNIEYRRIGNDGGGWPGTFHDVANASDYLRALAPLHQLDLTRVVAIGHSAGGHLALWLAARPRIPAGDVLSARDPLPLKAAISLAGVNDLRRAWELKLSNTVTAELMGGGADELPSRYASTSPFELLPLCVPQILIHGTADANVPFEISQRYYDAASACGDDVTLIPLEGTGHFELVDPGSREWPVVLDAVQRMI